MIPNILNTLLIALSTAIGVNNANFNYEKKQRLNYSNESTYNITYNTNDLTNSSNWSYWNSVYNALNEQNYNTATPMNIYSSDSLVYYRYNNQIQSIDINKVKVQEIDHRSIIYYTDSTTRGIYLSLNLNTHIWNLIINDYTNNTTNTYTDITSLSITSQTYYNLINPLWNSGGNSSSSQSSETTSSSSTSSTSQQMTTSTINIHENFTQKANYNYTEYGATIYAKKYFLNNSSENGIYTNPYLNIAHTVYTFYETPEASEDLRNSYVIGIYQFTNYYNSQITINMESVIRSIQNGSMAYVKETYITDNATAPINETLNDSLLSRLTDYKDGGTQLSTNTGNDSNTYANLTINNITFNASETKTFTFYFNRSTSSQDFYEAAPTQFNVTGTAYIPQTTSEVVDIPGMMFTVLALPFSFISQAFNLTIFPGTPYQINFTNLFMTIIAIFVLLWLMRHILGGK